MDIEDEDGGERAFLQFTSSSEPLDDSTSEKRLDIVVPHHGDPNVLAVVRRYASRDHTLYTRSPETLDGSYRIGCIRHASHRDRGYDAEAVPDLDSATEIYPFCNMHDVIRWVTDSSSAFASTVAFNGRVGTRGPVAYLGEEDVVRIWSRDILTVPLVHDATGNWSGIAQVNVNFFRGLSMLSASAGIGSIPPSSCLVPTNDPSPEHRDRKRGRVAHGGSTTTVLYVQRDLPNGPFIRSYRWTERTNRLPSPFDLIPEPAEQERHSQVGGESVVPERHVRIMEISRTESQGAGSSEEGHTGYAALFFYGVNRSHEGVYNRDQDNVFDQFDVRPVGDIVLIPVVRESVNDPHGTSPHYGKAMSKMLSVYKFTSVSQDAGVVQSLLRLVDVEHRKDKPSTLSMQQPDKRRSSPESGSGIGYRPCGLERGRSSKKRTNVDITPEYMRSSSHEQMDPPAPGRTDVVVSSFQHRGVYISGVVEGTFVAAIPSDVCVLDHSVSVEIRSAHAEEAIVVILEQDDLSEFRENSPGDASDQDEIHGCHLKVLDTSPSGRILAAVSSRPGYCLRNWPTGEIRIWWGHRGQMKRMFQSENTGEASSGVYWSRATVTQHEIYAGNNTAELQKSTARMINTLRAADMRTLNVAWSVLAAAEEAMDPQRKDASRGLVHSLPEHTKNGILFAQAYVEHASAVTSIQQSDLIRSASDINKFWNENADLFDEWKKNSVKDRNQADNTLLTHMRIKVLNEEKTEQDFKRVSRLIAMTSHPVFATYNYSSFGSPLHRILMYSYSDDYRSAVVEDSVKKHGHTIKKIMKHVGSEHPRTIHGTHLFHAGSLAKTILDHFLERAPGARSESLPASLHSIHRTACLTGTQDNDFVNRCILWGTNLANVVPASDVHPEYHLVRTSSHGEVVFDVELAFLSGKLWVDVHSAMSLSGETRTFRIPVDAYETGITLRQMCDVGEKEHGSQRRPSVPAMFRRATNAWSPHMKFTLYSVQVGVFRSCLKHALVVAYSVYYGLAHREARQHSERAVQFMKYADSFVAHSAGDSSISMDNTGSKATSEILREQHGSESLPYVGTQGCVYTPQENNEVYESKPPVYTLSKSSSHPYPRAFYLHSSDTNGSGFPTELSDAAVILKSMPLRAWEEGWEGMERAKLYGIVWLHDHIFAYQRWNWSTHEERPAPEPYTSLETDNGIIARQYQGASGIANALWNLENFMFVQRETDEDSMHKSEKAIRALSLVEDMGVVQDYLASRLGQDGWRISTDFVHTGSRRKTVANELLKLGPSPNVEGTQLACIRWDMVEEVLVRYNTELLDLREEILSTPEASRTPALVPTLGLALGVVSYIETILPDITPGVSGPEHVWLKMVNGDADISRGEVNFTFRLRVALSLFILAGGRVDYSKGRVRISCIIRYLGNVYVRMRGGDSSKEYFISCETMTFGSVQVWDISPPRVGLFLGAMLQSAIAFDTLRLFKGANLDHIMCSLGVYGLWAWYAARRLLLLCTFGNAYGPMVFAEQIDAAHEDAYAYVDNYKKRCKCSLDDLIKHEWKQATIRKIHATLHEDEEDVLRERANTKGTLFGDGTHDPLFQETAEHAHLRFVQTIVEPQRGDATSYTQTSVKETAETISRAFSGDPLVRFTTETFIHDNVQRLLDGKGGAPLLHVFMPNGSGSGMSFYFPPGENPTNLNDRDRSPPRKLQRTGHSPLVDNIFGEDALSRNEEEGMSREEDEDEEEESGRAMVEEEEEEAPALRLFGPSHLNPAPGQDDAVSPGTRRSPIVDGYLDSIWAGRVDERRFREFSREVSRDLFNKDESSEAELSIWIDCLVQARGYMLDGKIARRTKGAFSREPQSWRDCRTCTLALYEGATPMLVPFSHAMTQEILGLYSPRTPYEDLMDYVFQNYETCDIYAVWERTHVASKVDCDTLLRRTATYYVPMGQQVSRAQLDATARFAYLFEILVVSYMAKNEVFRASKGGPAPGTIAYISNAFKRAYPPNIFESKRTSSGIWNVLDAMAPLYFTGVSILPGYDTKHVPLADIHFVDGSRPGEGYPQLREKIFGVSFGSTEETDAGTDARVSKLNAVLRERLEHSLREEKQVIDIGNRYVLSRGSAFPYTIRAVLNPTSMVQNATSSRFDSWKRVSRDHQNKTPLVRSMRCGSIRYIGLGKFIRKVVEHHPLFKRVVSRLDLDMIASKVETIAKLCLPLYSTGTKKFDLNSEKQRPIRRTTVKPYRVVTSDSFMNYIVKEVTSSGERIADKRVHLNLLRVESYQSFLGRGCVGGIRSVYDAFLSPAQTYPRADGSGVEPPVAPGPIETQDDNTYVEKLASWLKTHVFTYSGKNYLALYISSEIPVYNRKDWLIVSNRAKMFRMAKTVEGRNHPHHIWNPPGGRETQEKRVNDSQNIVNNRAFVTTGEEVFARSLFLLAATRMLKDCLGDASHGILAPSLLPNWVAYRIANVVEAVLAKYSVSRSDAAAVADVRLFEPSKEEDTFDVGPGASLYYEGVIEGSEAESRHNTKMTPDAELPVSRHIYDDEPTQVLPPLSFGSQAGVFGSFVSTISHTQQILSELLRSRKAPSFVEKTPPLLDYPLENSVRSASDQLDKHAPALFCVLQTRPPPTRSRQSLGLFIAEREVLVPAVQMHRVRREEEGGREYFPSRTTGPPTPFSEYPTRALQQRQFPQRAVTNPAVFTVDLGDGTGKKWVRLVNFENNSNLCFAASEIHAFVASKHAMRLMLENKLGAGGGGGANADRYKVQSMYNSRIVHSGDVTPGSFFRFLSERLRRPQIDARQFGPMNQMIGQQQDSSELYTKMFEALSRREMETFGKTLTRQLYSVVSETYRVCSRCNYSIAKYDLNDATFITVEFAYSIYIFLPDGSLHEALFEPSWTPTSLRCLLRCLYKSSVWNVPPSEQRRIDALWDEETRVRTTPSTYREKDEFVLKEIKRSWRWILQIIAGTCVESHPFEYGLPYRDVADSNSPLLESKHTRSFSKEAGERVKEALRTGDWTSVPKRDLPLSDLYTVCILDACTMMSSSVSSPSRELDIFKPYKTDVENTGFISRGKTLVFKLFENPELITISNYTLIKNFYQDKVEKGWRCTRCGPTFTVGLRVRGSGDAEGQTAQLTRSSVVHDSVCTKLGQTERAPTFLSTHCSGIRHFPKVAMFSYKNVNGKGELPKSVYMYDKSFHTKYEAMADNIRRVAQSLKDSGYQGGSQTRSMLYESVSEYLGDAKSLFEFSPSEEYNSWKYPVRIMPELELDLTAMSPLRKEAEGAFRYRLVSTVVHVSSNGSANGGHYLCYVRPDPDGHPDLWYMLDDVIANSDAFPVPYGLVRYNMVPMDPVLPTRDESSSSFGKDSVDDMMSKIRQEERRVQQLYINGDCSSGFRQGSMLMSFYERIDEEGGNHSASKYHAERLFSEDSETGEYMRTTDIRNVHLPGTDPIRGIPGLEHAVAMFKRLQDEEHAQKVLTILSELPRVPHLREELFYIRAKDIDEHVDSGGKRPLFPDEPSPRGVNEHHGDVPIQDYMNDAFLSHLTSKLSEESCLQVANCLLESALYAATLFGRRTGDFPPALGSERIRNESLSRESISFDMDRHRNGIVEFMNTEHRSFDILSMRLKFEMASFRRVKSVLDIFHPPDGPEHSGEDRTWDYMRRHHADVFTRNAHIGLFPTSITYGLTPSSNVTNGIYENHEVDADLFTNSGLPDGKGLFQLGNVMLLLSRKMGTLVSGEDSLHDKLRRTNYIYNHIVSSVNPGKVLEFGVHPDMVRTPGENLGSAHKRYIHEAHRVCQTLFERDDMQEDSFFRQGIRVSGQTAPTFHRPHQGQMRATDGSTDAQSIRKIAASEESGHPSPVHAGAALPVGPETDYERHSDAQVVDLTDRSPDTLEHLLEILEDN